MSDNEAMEHISTEHLLNYADGRLVPQEHRRVEQHLADCVNCRADLAALRQTISMLAEDDWVMPPARVRTSVQRAFRQQAAEGASRSSFLEWLGTLLAPRRGPALALALLLVILAAGLAYRALQTPPPAQAIAASSVSGPAEVQSAGSEEWQSLQGGAALNQDDLLRTGSSGSVVMTFPDGSTMQVRPGSLLAVRELQSDPRAVALEQRLGETRSRVLPAAGPASGPAFGFEISTPSALVTTGGAEFDVIVDDAQATRVVVSSGEVSVVAAGATLALGASQEAAVQPGREPQLVSPEPTPTATATATSTATATPSATATASSTPTPAPPEPAATAVMEPTEPPPPPPTEAPDEDDDTPEPTEEPDDGDDHTPEPTEEPDDDDDAPKPTEEPDDDDDTPEPTRKPDND